MTEPWLLGPAREDLRSASPLLKLVDAGRELAPSVRAGLVKKGLRARSRAVSDDHAVAEADALICYVTSLAWVVRRCVQSLFALETDNPAYDLSHSEPDLAGSIFVSMPPAGPVGTLRLAEAIVHEAMHLNLGRLEAVAELTTVDDFLYSPWKKGSRPAAGVLHGVYVFTCLHRFFRTIGPSLPLGSAIAAHARNRIAEIEREMTIIDLSALRRQLTLRGQALLDGLQQAMA